MIFQEPMTSLNPVYTVGDQIVEGLRRHRAMGAREARERAVEMLRVVRIPSPETRSDAYPHQLSGGMRQRVMIAMALACEPELLIADEPTTALDVTIQAQILDLMRDLQARLGTAIILITHDLGVVAETADEVVVMYAGKVVERGRRPHPVRRRRSTPTPSASSPRSRASRRSATGCRQSRARSRRRTRCRRAAASAPLPARDRTLRRGGATFKVPRPRASCSLLARADRGAAHMKDRAP